MPITTTPRPGVTPGPADREPTSHLPPARLSPALVRHPRLRASRFRLGRVRLVAALASAAALAMLAACGGEGPPAVTAAGLGYSRDEVLGLSEDRRLLLGELAAFGVAVADSTLPEVLGPWVEARRRDRLQELFWARQALDEAGVEEEVLRARYLTDPAHELTVRHLLILSPRYETDATRAAAREKAVGALERIRAGEPFPDVAAEVSEEPGAEGREGLLSPGREGDWVDEFWNAALGLEPGEISGVVETQYGFHVLRLEDRSVVPFEEMRPVVELDVARMMGAAGAGGASPPLPDGYELVQATLDGAPGTVVARWSGGELTVAQARDAVATLPYREWRRVTAGEGLDAALEAAARSHAAAAEAAEAGLSVTDAWIAGIRNDRVREAEGWGTLLGLRLGMSRDEVRAAALRAFEASGQNASLAREDVRSSLGPLLHRAFVIETAPDGEA